MKDKGILNPQLIEELSEELDIDFLDWLNQANTQRKPISNQYYEDIKYQGKVDIPIDISRKHSLRKPHGVEFRCKLV